MYVCYICCEDCDIVGPGAPHSRPILGLVQTKVRNTNILFHVQLCYIYQDVTLSVNARLPTKGYLVFIHSQKNLCILGWLHTGLVHIL